jgi:hypothetical protein
MRDRIADERRTVVAACAAFLLLLAGCAGIPAAEPDASATRVRESTPARGTNPTSAPPASAAPADAQEWNATVDIRAERTSFASGEYAFNGWNVSIRVTSIEGADEVVYVYEATNVVKGDSTREGVVGAEVGDATSERSLFLLQRGATVTVYAVNGDERKRIGFLEITSSYVAPWDGERGWSDSWRGTPPEEAGR